MIAEEVHHVGGESPQVQEFRGGDAAPGYKFSIGCKHGLQDTLGLGNRNLFL